MRYLKQRMAALIIWRLFNEMLLKYIFLCLFVSCVVESCTKISSCACVFSLGTVDLSPLANLNGTAFVSELPGGGGHYRYSWNPCHSFTDGHGCTDVAACQTDPSGHRYSLGTQDTSHFITDQRLGLLITYHSTTDAHRRLFVRLECNHSVEYDINVQGETAPESTKYFINLISKYACPIPGGVVPTTTRMTTGEILIIVLVVVILLYVTLVLGFQLVVRKASGRKLFPDYCFWFNIPHLIKNFHVSYRVAKDTDNDAAALVYHVETETSLLS